MDMVEASESLAPVKISAKCKPPMKKTAGISTFHWPGTALSQGARQISTKTKRSAVNSTGGMNVTPILAATALRPQTTQTSIARKRWEGRMNRFANRKEEH